MQVLILTNNEHLDFVNSVVEKNRGLAHFDISRFIPSGLRYDVGVSYMYQRKVPKEELDKADWINFHPAPLPEYKGRNLCYHAIMNGEHEFGASVHYMDENFDTGDIIAVHRFPIFERYTAEILHKVTMGMAEVMFETYLPEIAVGTKFTRYNNFGGTYYKKEPIDDFLHLSERDKKSIRAITYKKFYPKVRIGKDVYKIVRDG